VQSRSLCAPQDKRRTKGVRKLLHFEHLNYHDLDQNGTPFPRRLYFFLNTLPESTNSSYNLPFWISYLRKSVIVGGVGPRSKTACCYEKVFPKSTNLVIESTSLVRYLRITLDSMVQYAAPRRFRCLCFGGGEAFRIIIRLRFGRMRRRLFIRDEMEGQ